MKAELTDGGHPGTIFICNMGAWMMLGIFFNGVYHFLVYTTPTPYYLALLILVGHVAHTRNLEIIERARENTLTVLCLPPHSTHRSQPEDVSLMYDYPLSTYDLAALVKGTNNRPGHVAKTFEISCICDEACLLALKLQAQ
jgi:hypothetical protein